MSGLLLESLFFCSLAEFEKKKKEKARKEQEKERRQEEEEREERRSSNEVICENLKLIVLRPQLGNNNIQGRQGRLGWGNFHNYILGM